MRIVAGTARGRSLVAPDGDTTRPTSDRVREAVFNALFSLDDPVDGAQVVDLFAGTGALGLEAISRGAAHVTFVERDGRALAALERNVRGTGAPREAVEVVRADALGWLGARADRGAAPFDVALVDPPYRFDGWAGVLAALDASIAVLESDRDLTTEVETSGRWAVIRHRRYGGTVVTMVRHLVPD